MRFGYEFFFRIGGGLLGATLAALFGSWLAQQIRVTGQQEIYVSVLTILGFIVGLLITPYLTIRPLRRARILLVAMPTGRLLAVLGGIFLGLIAASLLTIPLSTLPSPLRQVLPLLSAIVLCYLGVYILTFRQKDLREAIGFYRPNEPIVRSQTFDDRQVLLDTSVIIDGRIGDICKTGFIRSTLVVPNFVLLELQHIADSSDPLRRNRGRRGMDVLKFLQDDCPVPIQFSDMDATEIREVDSKLVALAQQLNCPIMTNDYNLNRIAELQGVTVLNINDLANAVKAVFLPGEELAVKIVQEGREVGQGVAYLDDGTMIVVEDGKNHMQDSVDVVVTKVLQTTAGRMIFARPQNNSH
jgi:uncharacterized protein YacL